MDGDKIVKTRFNAFFSGVSLKSSGVVKILFKTRLSNFPSLSKIFGYQKSEVDIYARVGASNPEHLGRFIFDKCVLRADVGELSFSSLRESVELGRLFRLPLPAEDVFEFELLCKNYIADSDK